MELLCILKDNQYPEYSKQNRDNLYPWIQKFIARAEDLQITWPVNFKNSVHETTALLV